MLAITQETNARIKQIREESNKYGTSFMQPSPVLHSKTPAMQGQLSQCIQQFSNSSGQSLTFS